VTGNTRRLNGVCMSFGTNKLVQVMNKLHEAYGALGLNPGSSLEEIKARYKCLVMVWHPDRMPSGNGKHDAEEELRKINAAQDLLDAHFQDGHHQSGGFCQCEPEASNQNTSSNTETTRTRTRARDEEAERAQEEEKKRDAAEAKSQMEWEAKVKEAEGKRWDYSKLAGKAFVALLTFSFIVTSLKNCGGSN
jgi:curved DNA-binding protein CbpA